KVRLDFPAVLRKQINRFAAHQFMLRRSLYVRARQSKEIVGIRGIRSYVVSRGIRGRGIKYDLTVHVKVQKLVKFLVTQVSAKFQAVRPDNFAEVVADLKRV